MQALGLVRHFIQAAAFAIFVYQMIVATGKYMSFSTLPSVETKELAEVNLPHLYICIKDRELREDDNIKKLQLLAALVGMVLSLKFSLLLI